MGLNFNTSRCLFYAKSIGVNYEKTAMIGRQVLYATKKDFREIFASFNYDINESSIESILKKNGGYAEEFLGVLGANHVDSFDNSNYEGANCIHDFNHPVPDKFKNRYTVVFDGGSLEHIFNFPIAIKNCMEMLKEGGYYLGFSPANNWMGHGFYQFSPELFFRIFNNSNGFEMTKMLIFERDTKSSFYSVEDPAVLGERAILSNYIRSNIFIIAKKVSNQEIFSQVPMQIDYIDRWEARMTSVDEAKSYKPPRGLRPLAIKLLIKCLKITSANRGYDPKFFKQLDI